MYLELSQNYIRYLGNLVRCILLISIIYLLKEINIYVHCKKYFIKPKTSPQLIKIFYFTRSGSSKKYALSLLQYLQKYFVCILIDLCDYDPEYFTKEMGICLFILPSYPQDSFYSTESNSNCLFFQWIYEAPNDFRIDRHSLRHLRFSIFGIGDSAYGSNFNTSNLMIHENLKIIGGIPLLPLYKADLSTEGIGISFKRWKNLLVNNILPLQKTREFKENNDTNKIKLVCKTNNVKICRNEKSSNKPYLNKNISDDFVEFSCKSMLPESLTKSSINDLEDMGEVLNKAKAKLPSKRKIDTVAFEKGEADLGLPKMLTEETREALTKQGYKVVGSHSAVKVCRWTKSALRGRGGCYKHTFYGIDSSRCIESTPSLACANKCVFCWRHHSNPVGTEWKWQMDDPQIIFKEIVSQHKAMIKECRGIPGVTPEKLNLGLIPRHCALSLVGEPIMYPKINEFIRLLHESNISTFLVTNAQFPSQIRDLTPVTQLYVSIDAHDAQSLKKIDRPLHRDFWERFIECLKELSVKKGITRTVYRLTLVKKWNFSEKYCKYVKDEPIDIPVEDSLALKNEPNSDIYQLIQNEYEELFDQDIRNYVELIKIGVPDFIEIKGVTFCGTAGNELTMKDIPWHSDVVEFGTALARACKHPRNTKFYPKSSILKDETEGTNVLIPPLPNYEIACEHEHSNCILLADSRFKINDEWHTWIDYDEFNSMITNFYDASANPQDKSQIVTKSYVNSLKYSCATPTWSHVGSFERGFDPEHQRMTGFNRDAKRREREMENLL